MLSRGNVTAKTQEHSPNETLIPKDCAGRETEIRGPGKEPVTRNPNIVSRFRVQLECGIQEVS